MQAIVAVLLAGSLGSGAAAAPKTLTPERLREALEFGRTASEEQVAQYELKTAETWLVNFDTPFLRVAQFASYMRKSEKAVVESEVPARFLANEINLYVHARFQESAHTLPNVEYVSIQRPTADGRTETVLPRDVDRFVRQVPTEKPYWGPARIAKSVRASFPPGALVAGGSVRILFEGGVIESVPIDAALLARVR